MVGEEGMVVIPRVCGKGTKREGKRRVWSLPQEKQAHVIDVRGPGKCECAGEGGDMLVAWGERKVQMGVTGF